MQTIGLVGGMSWESSAVYYRPINEGVRRRLGALHSAKIVLWSAEFQDIAEKQAAGDWDALLRWVIPLSFTAGVVVTLLVRRRAAPPQDRASTLRSVVAVVNGGLIGVVVGC